MVSTPIPRNRTVLELPLSKDSIGRWRQQVLQWALDRYDHVVLFNSNTDSFLDTNPDRKLPDGLFPDRLAIGSYHTISFIDHEDPFDQLYRFHRQQPDFLVGYLSYELKNRIEPLHSRNPNRLGFPEIYFFQPLHVIDFHSDSVTIHSLGDIREIIDRSLPPNPFLRNPTISPTLERYRVEVRPRVSPSDYNNTVKKIQNHILAGDIYELNYCIEFFQEGIQIDPLLTYNTLNRLSPMPFSSFQRIGDHYLMGASPERFFRKIDRRIVSQPIKGTMRRGRNQEEDNAMKHALRTSEKEQAENLMIVDLVRNDLARSAEIGSVQVDELFGVYSFRQVHQLISTVSATLRHDVPFSVALRNAFPMGSMTGAPKVRAMELIDQYEVSQRGLYSGAMGFITPTGDCDFNVVIRSILYNATRQYLSFSVGSAITYDAEPEQEYRECLLKAEAMLMALKGL